MTEDDEDEMYGLRCGMGSLEVENARLRECLVHMELHECPGCKNVADLQEALDENTKLKKLVLDMYGFIERMDEECGDVTFSDCFDYCKHDTTDDGCCKTGKCWYEQHMRELGLEVDDA